MNTQLEEYRNQLDSIDSRITELLQKRFNITDNIGKYKCEHGIAINDPSREGILLDRIRKLSGECYADYICALYQKLMTESKYSQSRVIYGNSDIFLVGMPGCGKSTIAGKLSDKLCGEDIDLDELFMHEYGFTCAEFIVQFGEDEFRRNESLLLDEVINRIIELRSHYDNSPYIISCGGGTVIRKCNTDLMKKHGIIIYIKRDNALLQIEGRPLSEKNGINSIYEARHKLYENCADIVVDNNTDIDSCVDLIAAKLQSYKGIV